MRLKRQPPVFLENVPVSTLPAQTQILNIPPSEPGMCRKLIGAIILMLGGGHFTRLFLPILFSVLIVCFIILYHPSLLGLPTL